MPAVDFTNLLGLLAIAFVVPVTFGFVPRLRVPAVVAEIIAGIAVGPSGLNWIRVDLGVEVVAILGLAMLLFLAGLEIDAHALRGRLLPLAVVGYAISLAVGSGLALSLSSIGWVDAPFLFAVTVSATSLGLVVAVLKDAHALDGDLGRTVVATASVADFAAVLLLSVLFSGMTGNTGARLLLLGGFAVAMAVIVTALFASRSAPQVGAVVSRLQDGTAEIRVRGAMLLLLGCVVVAEHLGLEAILGAFAAGAIVAAVDRDTRTHPHFRLKLEAIGYGFLIPVFFIASGVRLDLAALFTSGSAIARVPVFVIVLLLARGLPTLLQLRMWGARRTASAALLQATSLPFIVTATQIGVSLDAMSATTAAALVCAGVLSVVAFPALANALGLRD